MHQNTSSSYRTLPAAHPQADHSSWLSNSPARGLGPSSGVRPSVPCVIVCFVICDPAFLASAEVGELSCTKQSQGATRIDAVCWRNLAGTRKGAKTSIPAADTRVWSIQLQGQSAELDWKQTFFLVEGWRWVTVGVHTKNTTAMQRCFMCLRGLLQQQNEHRPQGKQR